jgi:signal transduction histidine kinase
MKLYLKLFLLITPLIIIPSIVVTNLIRSHLITEAQSSFNIQANSLVLKIANQIENKINSAKTDTLLFSQLPLVKQYVLNDNVSRQTILLPNILATFNNIQKIIPSYYEIQIINPEGLELASSSTDNKLIGEQQPNQDHFQLIKKSKKDINIFTFHDQVRQKNALMISHRLKFRNPIYDNYNDLAKVRAYLLIKIDLSDIKQQIESQIIGKTGYLLLYNKDKQLIFETSQNTYKDISKDLLSNLSTNLETHLTHLNLIEKIKLASNNFLIYKHLLPEDFTLVGLLPEEDILASSRKLVMLAIIISLMTIMVILILIFFSLNRLVIRPLLQLNTATKLFGEYKKKVKLEITSQDEIGKLSISFIAMMNSILNNIESLKDARTKAEQANKAKSSFLSNMSHEIRTPLNGVIGLSQLLERQSLNLEQQETVNKLNHSAQLLQKLINDILDLAKIESGKLKLEETTFNLSTIINECLITFEQLAIDKGLTITSQINQSIPNLLKGDSLRISQILLNFISNALKFTKAGSITIKAELVNTSAHNIILQLSVIDTGIGMSEETQENIFANFTQADSSISRQYGGSGLGLSICKQLVELMQGQISVQSTLGYGSTLTCNLPLVVVKEKEEDNRPIGNINKDKIKHHHGMKVLVVDDEEINLFLAQGLLETEGILVTIADRGKKALKLAEQEQFDIVLMDIHMPVLDGWETTRQFRASSLTQLSDVIIIGLTADVFKESQDRCLEAGMNLVIAKPFEFTDLMQKIDSLFMDGH